METDYTVSDVLEIGKAQDVILGSKDVFTSDDGTESILAGDVD